VRRISCFVRRNSRRCPWKPTAGPRHDPYAVDAILRACRVLRSFRFDDEVLTLSDVVERTGIHKATAFRTLHSLVAGGILGRAGKDPLPLRIKTFRLNRIRIGYAAMTENSVFRGMSPTACGARLKNAASNLWNATSLQR